jgi:hypothetical protein
MISKMMEYGYDANGLVRAIGYSIRWQTKLSLLVKAEIYYPTRMT